MHTAYAKFLKDLNDSSQKGSELLVANALWGQKGFAFLPDYVKLVQTGYNGAMNEVDFAAAAEAARATINAWVAKQTNDKIKDLLGPPACWTPTTRLVLTNAIYFKGKWAEPFKKDATAIGPFRSGRDRRLMSR